MPKTEKYESYVDSNIEWLGEIPSTWKMLLLSQAVTQVKNKNSDLQEQNLLSLSYGKIKRKAIDTTGGLLPASFDGYNIIEKNDIVLRLTDLQNDHTSLRVGLAQEKGIITSAYVTMRPRMVSSAKYLYYLLHTFDIRKGFYGMGSGVRQGLNYDEVKKLRIPLPSSEEQQAIAGYLDEVCSQIDSIIFEAKASIEDYKHWKASIIYEAVTKGLDPDVEMKDSGVKWIGEIPEYWKVSTVRKILLRNDGGIWGDDPVDGQGTVVLRSTEQTVDGKWKIDSPAVRNLSQINNLTDYYVKQGDLLITKSSGSKLHIGKTTIVTSEIEKMKCCYSNFMQRLRVKEHIFPIYFWYLLNSDISRKQFVFLQNSTSGIGNINSKDIGAIKIPIPPLNEQKLIVRYLESQCSRIDLVITEKESLIADLEAYKKSLIYEVVTGKRRVD